MKGDTNAIPVQQRDVQMTQIWSYFKAHMFVFDVLMHNTVHTATVKLVVMSVRND